MRKSDDFTLRKIVVFFCRKFMVKTYYLFASIFLGKQLYYQVMLSVATRCLLRSRNIPRKGTACL